MARPKAYSPTTSQWLQSLYTPGVLMAFAAFWLVYTVLAVLFTQPTKLLTFSKVKDEAFSRFWMIVSGPDPAPKPTELIGPPALVPPLLSQAAGDILEIGPGTGIQLAYTTPSRINAYYAAEPALGLHTSLNKHAKRAGLKPGKNFHILPCGGHAEALIPGLRTAGLLPTDKAIEPIFDTIVTIRVLCSVPSAKITLDNLYALLKPGGKLIVVEHVVNQWTGPYGSLLGRSCQLIYTMLGWSFLIGDCHLNRDTEALLRRVGAGDGADWSGWMEDTDSGVQLSSYLGALPHISGILTKR